MLVLMGTSGRQLQTGPNARKPRLKKYLPPEGTFWFARGRIAPSAIRTAEGVMLVCSYLCNWTTILGWRCPVACHTRGGAFRWPEAVCPRVDYQSTLGWQLLLPSDRTHILLSTNIVPQGDQYSPCPMALTKAKLERVQS